MVVRQVILRPEHLRPVRQILRPVRHIDLTVLLRPERHQAVHHPEHLLPEHRQAVQQEVGDTAVEVREAVVAVEVIAVAHVEEEVRQEHELVVAVLAAVAEGNY